LLPQQVAVPSARKPQVCSASAEICTKLPALRVHCPKSSLPQQVTLLSTPSPHAWRQPAEISVNLLVTGVWST
jgi:hypothetical protein